MSLWKYGLGDDSPTYSLFSCWEKRLFECRASGKRWHRSGHFYFVKALSIAELVVMNWFMTLWVWARWQFEWWFPCHAGRPVTHAVNDTNQIALQHVIAKMSGAQRAQLTSTLSSLIPRSNQRFLVFLIAPDYKIIRTGLLFIQKPDSCLLYQAVNFSFIFLRGICYVLTKKK